MTEKQAFGCLGITLLVGLATCAKCASWCNDVDRETKLRLQDERREREKEDTRRAAAYAKEQAGREASKQLNAEIAAQERRDLIAKYAAMKSWQRLTLPAKLCPISVQDDCSLDDLSALAEAVKGLGDEKSVITAIDSARKRRDAAQREAGRNLLCCDGSESSCLCHAPSHRGCCSHHRGVCGCAAP